MYKQLLQVQLLRCSSRTLPKPNGKSPYSGKPRCYTTTTTGLLWRREEQFTLIKRTYAIPQLQVKRAISTKGKGRPLFGALSKMKGAISSKWKGLSLLGTVSKMKGGWNGLPMLGAVSKGSICIWLIFVPFTLVVWQYYKSKHDRKIQQLVENPEQEIVGTALIGGEFELIDVNGNTVTNYTFLGKWLFIYFGFCHCPDICPEQLDKMTTVIEKVKQVKHLPQTLQPLYITVDPERDSKERVKKYLEDFHPDILGLCGTVEQVQKCCKAYRIYYSNGPKDEDEDYVVDHSIIMYLMGPDGKFVSYYRSDMEIDYMVEDISEEIWKQADSQWAQE